MERVLQKRSTIFIICENVFQGRILLDLYDNIARLQNFAWWVHEPQLYELTRKKFVDITNVHPRSYKDTATSDISDEKLDHQYDT